MTRMPAGRCRAAGMLFNKDYGSRRGWTEPTFATIADARLIFHHFPGLSGLAWIHNLNLYLKLSMRRPARASTARPWPAEIPLWLTRLLRRRHSG